MRYNHQDYHLAKFEEEYFQHSLYSKGKEDRGQIEAFFTQQVLLHAKNAKSILDIGCGEGQFLENFSKLRFEVKGVDISSYAVKTAQKRLGKNIFKVDIEKEKLPFKNCSFDIVTSLDVVEHLAQDDNFFHEAFRVLKPGGLLFLTTPNHGSIFGYFFGNFFLDDRTHVNKQRKKYWIEKLLEAGFGNFETAGIALYGFPPVASLRNLFRKIGIPVRVQPILFPIQHFCAILLIFARRG